MRVPGSNLLNMALRVIGKQTVGYYAFVARETNSIGLDVATYADPVTVQGSVQPVPRALFERLGLDFQKAYWTVFVPRDVIDVTRDVSGDQMVFNGIRLQCLSKTPWSKLDGWDEVLCVEVPVPGETRRRITTTGAQRITADLKRRFAAGP